MVVKQTPGDFSINQRVCLWVHLIETPEGEWTFATHAILFLPPPLWFKLQLSHFRKHFNVKDDRSSNYLIGAARHPQCNWRANWEQFIISSFIITSKIDEAGGGAQVSGFLVRI